MNAERLLAHYDRIADSPDAIPRLRCFILNLAVRGKLVLQDPNDEPASELLKRIAAEKTRLVKAGEIRRTPSALPGVEDPPFDIPPSWRWTRVREVTSDRGQTVPIADFTYIDVTAIDKENGIVAAPKVLAAKDAPSRARKITRKGDVIYSCVRPYLLNVAVIENEFDPPPIASTAFAVLDGQGLVLPRYLWIVLRSPFLVECVEAKMRGQAYPAINDAEFAVLPLPLPPLAEQMRIVAKVDELMVLCDQLEAVRVEREATRDRLTVTSFAHLNAPDPDTFQDNVRFVLDALPALTARPDQIKQLRQTILNLAVRGKLVPQDPNSEPAIQFDQTTPDELDRPFDLPRNWNWTRLRALGNLKGGGTPSKARDDFWNGSIPWVSPKDMKVDYLAEAQMSITESAITCSATSMIEAGSVLFVVRGMILAHSFPVAVTRVPVAINQDMKALVLKKPEMAEFILHALKGMKPEMLARVQRSTHGTCRIEGSDYSDFLVPIPPLAEQRRIVAKVHELMALCDGLEKSLVSGAGIRHRLLNALLAEALEPVGGDLERAA